MSLPQPDLGVLRKAQRGDERAFAIIVRTYEQPVFNYIVRLTGDRNLAEDLTQEVFLRVFQGISGFSLRSRFTTWLFQVTKNRVLDELRAIERRPRAVVQLEDIPPLEVVDAPAERAETIDAVWRSVERLNPDLKMALLLRDVVGLSYTEIAETLEITLATVKWRIYKAREEVQLALHREGVVVPIRSAPSAISADRSERARQTGVWFEPDADSCAAYDGAVAVHDPVSDLALSLSEIAGVPVVLERPGDSDHGDYATNVALRLAPTQGRAPREIAADLAAEALRGELAEAAEPAGPGFLNLHMSDAWLTEALSGVLTAAGDFGARTASDPERIQVEMVSANPTGPLTVATARNAAYGDSVARVLAFAGHDVEREYYYNDAGTQMERFYASVEAVRRGEEPPEDGYRGEYIAELARQPGDPVPPMLARIEQTLERFRVHFDTWVLQSDVESEIPEAIALLETFEQDDAVWARTSAHGDDKDRVLIRSDGTPGYFAADAAYVRRKYAREFDRLIYVLGADHHGYVGRLQALAEMLGHPRDSLEVLIYQLVHLVEGGMTKKMSKRRGDVAFLDDLLDTIGVDAARWYLVSRGHDQTIELDVDLAKQRNQKNPVYYVQYAHARIAGILRNAAETGVAAAGLATSATALAREERDLVKRLLEFPALVGEAADRRGPHSIPNYAIRVADDFHRFYHEHRVLDSENEAFRLALCLATQHVVARCLDLIGVEAPDRM